MNDLISSFLTVTVDSLIGAQLRGTRHRRLSPPPHDGDSGRNGNNWNSGSDNGSNNGSSNGGSSSGGSGYDNSSSSYGYDTSSNSSQSDMSTASSGTNGNSNGWSASTSHQGNAWLIAALLGAAILACCLACCIMRNRRKREIEESKTVPSELDDEDSFGNIQQEYDQMEDPKEPEDVDPSRWQSLDDDAEVINPEEPPIHDIETTPSQHTGARRSSFKGKAKGVFSKVKSKLKRNK